MKFRTIYILFNVVVILSFFFVFFLPFFLLGAEYSLTFWKSNWYLALVFLVVIGVLNGFFVANWKVFTLVEAEDWKALSTHLSGAIFDRKRFGSRHVALFVNASLLQGDAESILRLEGELGKGRKDLLRKNAILFGVTRLLRGQSPETEAFLKPFVDAKGVDSRDWLRFDYALSIVNQERFTDALPYLKEAAASRDAVLSLLGSYFLGLLARKMPGEEAALAALAESSRAALRKRFPLKRWNAEVERAKGEIHIVVLTKFIDDAGRWLFEESSSAASPQAAGPGKAR